MTRQTHPKSVGAQCTDSRRGGLPAKFGANAAWRFLKLAPITEIGLRAPRIKEFGFLGAAFAAGVHRAQCPTPEVEHVW